MPTVYTKNGCPRCEMTKRFLTENEIDFKEINTTDYPEERQTVMDMGYQSFPVVVTDDKSWNGFDVPKLQELVGVV